VNLRDIYEETLRRCTPAALVQRHVHDDLPRNVVAIGKCAGPLLDGAAHAMRIDHAFAAIPRGYPAPHIRANVHFGGHPLMTPASFEAGRALADFAARHHDVTFLVSGGGSACVELPRHPHSEREVADENARLVASGLPIAAINARRRELSAIKGGRLRELVRGRAVTLVYSDVSTGALADVASGPTITDPAEAILVADNSTLVHTAAEIIGSRAVVLERQIESDVADAAGLLARMAEDLHPGQILVAGGEPTVVVRGGGKGGRCSELAVRFAALSPREALFGSSDGVDGNSGAAGVHVRPRTAPGLPPGSDAALAVSDSCRIATQVGEPIMIAATGNNLRDLFLVAG
jgi:glycerate 2-kinase